MAGRWDSITKILVKARPSHFSSWLVPQSTLVELLSVELNAAQFFADALLKIWWNGLLGLLHIEFQSYFDTNMGQRMLEYNVFAEHQHGLPVCSVAIYLRKQRVPKPPYVRRWLDNWPTHHFHYRVVKLWEESAQAILDLGWEGLLPLLPLTKGGKKPEIIQVMIDRLALSDDKDLLVLSEMFGSLAFTKEPERARFKRRYTMYQEIFRDSWFYQEILQEGEERGIEKGREEGLRIAIVQAVKQRFPDLEDLAVQQTELLKDFTALNVLLVGIIAVSDEAGARALLLGAQR